MLKIKLVAFCHSARWLVPVWTFTSIFEFALWLELSFSTYRHANDRCPDCKFPLCSAKCNDGDHTKIECHFLKTHNLHQYLHWQAHRFELQHDYEAITILRYGTAKVLLLMLENIPKDFPRRWFCILKSFLNLWLLETWDFFVHCRKFRQSLLRELANPWFTCSFLPSLKY